MPGAAPSDRARVCGVRALKTRPSNASDTRAARPVKTIVAASVAAARTKGLTRFTRSPVGIKFSTCSMHSLFASPAARESGSNPEHPLIQP